MLERLATRYSAPVVFTSVALCIAGIHAATTLTSSVFPQTDFPRVVILADNGVMPGDEMMATITRPIEEVMKNIPGVVNVRSATGRGSAEINVFFNWRVDMVRSELFVLSRLSEIRGTLPETTETTVYRLTFSAFPILGVSLTSQQRDITELWERARYDLKLRFLRIPGVARVDLVGGRAPEYHVVVDPLRLAAANLTLSEIGAALEANNLVAAAGFHEENHTLYLTQVDGRLRTREDIEQLVVGTRSDHPVRIVDVARVERGQEPVFNVVTADGQEAVLLNVRSQPDGSTLDIARAVRGEIESLRRELPPDYHIAFFYDQSQIVRASVRSVWEAIFFGLLLSVLILYLFLKSWGTTLVATTVIPVTVLVTLVAMQLAGQSFNLMTLGGIAAAIGLVIDDAIVVVEAIHTRRVAGASRQQAVAQGLGEIFRPLVGSTLTPVVVFVPLAFLDGITGVFFRALAVTMVVSLLTSLLLAVTLTPALATWLLRHHRARPRGDGETGDAHAAEGVEGGPLLRVLVRLYESAIRPALRHPWWTLSLCAAVLAAGVLLYRQLDTDFLPAMDEGGFVIDYFTPPGTSLSETNRQLLEAEEILRTVPEVASYSRRTGARLALAIAEPNTGDFLVKLAPGRSRTTEEVIAELRRRFNTELPGVEWEFPGILGDLIGDLTWSPQPIEVKLYSTDQAWLERTAPRIASELESVPGVVDVFDGLVYAGPSLSLRVRPLAAKRLGMSTTEIASAVDTALLGETASSVLEGDRTVDVRVMSTLAPEAHAHGTVTPSTIHQIEELPLRTPSGALVKLSQLVELHEEPGQLELRREDGRQDVAITARLEGRDLGSAIAEIRQHLAGDASLPPGTVELGGLYQQQRESFQNLVLVLVMAIVLVFLLLLLEFGSFAEAIAIVFGAVLALFGTVAALWLTHTTFNVVSFLGAIIGVGIVAKNGILMLDYVAVLERRGTSLFEALVGSGQRRLRPVLMTSLAAALGMLPLAWGVGSGADMLRPLAIAVIGALCISVLLSLVATPTLYLLLRRPSRARTPVDSRSEA